VNAIVANGSAHVRSDQRYTNGRRCLICGGAERDPRGKGRRCHGFLSADGEWAHCAREEHAGVLVSTNEGGTYGHRIGGPCKCGVVHSAREGDWDNIVAAYDYRDERGSLLYQVVRREPKSFLQRRPNGDGTWEWKTSGMRRVLYRLPELQGAPRRETVYIVEGEKDVDTLRARGLIATCNPMGEGKWHFVAEDAVRVLRGRHVAVIADGDDVGRKHAQQVAETLRTHVSTLRVLELPKKDVTEWFEAGGTVDELKQIVEHVEAESWEIAVEEPDPFDAEVVKAREGVQAALGSSTQKKRKPLFCTDIVELLGRTFGKPPWLVTGLVTHGGVTIIGGEPKTVKTWLALEIAISVATGTKVCGEFFAEHGTAAYFFAEDLDNQVHNRARALLAGAGRMVAEGRLFVETRGTFLDVLDDDDLAWIVASCRARFTKLDLLVLDPLRDLHSGEEDKSDSMREVMRRLRLLGELLGCTVCVVHHTSKVSIDTAKRRPGQRLRGSSAIHGSVDSGIYMSDCDGDGSNVFVNTLDSEVKGGRSAGHKQLELTVVDDELGAAVGASWRVLDLERKTKSKAARKRSQEEYDDADVMTWIRELAARGVVRSKTALRETEGRPKAGSQRADQVDRTDPTLRPASEIRVRRSMDRLLEAGSLVEVDGKIRLPQAGGEA
jgi:5S rRNA maturation endonuclease (ribonuclease M5)/KaiC/GvpD/RAD55 family RecA-like ATPase